MREKKKINELLITWSSYEMDGTLADVIAKLQKVTTDFPNHFDFTISVETESGYYDSYSTHIRINGIRMETDEEMEARIIASKKASESAKLAAKNRAIANEKREKSLYESLKKKFEKEIEETSKPQSLTK